MIDPKQQADLDQAAAFLAEAIPPTCRSIYTGLIQEGFTEAQAMDLVKTWLMSIHMRPS